MWYCGVTSRWIYSTSLPLQSSYIMNFSEPQFKFRELLPPPLLKGIPTWCAKLHHQRHITLSDHSLFEGVTKRKRRSYGVPQNEKNIVLGKVTSLKERSTDINRNQMNKNIDITANLSDWHRFPGKHRLVHNHGTIHEDCVTLHGATMRWNHYDVTRNELK